MIEFFSKNSVIISSVVFILFLLCLYFLREKKIVRQIIINAICEAEVRFNSGEGQAKLDFATEQIKKKLPRYLSFIVSKSIIVTFIEYFLNKGLQLVKSEKKIDIKGNEDLELVEKIDLNLYKKENSVELKYNKNQSIKENKAEVYGSLKVKTDWHDNPDTTIEVGIKKKL